MALLALTGCGSMGANSLQEIQSERALAGKTLDLAEYLAEREDEHKGCGKPGEGDLLAHNYDLDTTVNRTTSRGLHVDIYRSGVKRGDCLGSESRK